MLVGGPVGSFVRWAVSLLELGSRWCRSLAMGLRVAINIFSGHLALLTGATTDSSGSVVVNREVPSGTSRPLVGGEGCPRICYGRVVLVNTALAGGLTGMQLTGYCFVFSLACKASSLVLQAEVYLRLQALFTAVACWRGLGNYGMLII